MKSKLLMFIATLVASTGASVMQAQTDVTDTYLTNPSFDADGLQTAPSSITGWTIPTGMSNLNIEDETKTSSGFGVSTSSDGTYHFFNRKGWGNLVGTLSQVTKSMPAGTYYLCFDYKAADYSNNNNAAPNGSTLKLSVIQNDIELASTGEKKVAYSQGAGGSSPQGSATSYFTKTNWNKMGLFFTITEEGVVKISLTESLKNSGRSDMLFDNFRLFSISDDLNNFDLTGMVLNQNGDQIEGWTREFSSHTDAFQSQENSSFTTATSRFFEVWGNLANNPTPSTGKLYQKITGLPNGKYLLEAACMIQNQADATAAISNVSLYANTEKALITENTATTKSVECIVSDGTLEIGLRAEEANANWFCIDNIKLTYLNFDVTAIKNALQEQINNVPTGKMQTSIASELTNAINEATLIIANPNATKTDLEAAGNKLGNAISAANASIAAYIALKEAYEAANLNKVIFEKIKGYTAYNTEITKAQDLYAEASIDVAGINSEIENLKVAADACLKTAPNYTDYIKNPAADSNISNWNIEGNVKLRTMNNEHYSNQTNNYFDTDNWNDKVVGKVSQTIAELPAGTYLLKVAARGASGANMAIFANEEKVTVPCIGNTGGKLGRGWEFFTVKTTLTQDTPNLTIGVEFNNTNNTKWFSFDDFILYRLDVPYAISTTANTVSVHGTLTKAEETEINSTLTDQITSIDINATTISEAITIHASNPNTIVYGVNENISVTSGIKEGNTESTNINDTYSFHAPKALAATVSYIRAFNTNGAPCNQANGNWQTICLPFDVTSINATQEGNEISLTPILNFDGTEGADASRPFWLYKIEGNTLTATTEMKANVPYLVAIPNDAATYRPFYNVSGDVVFNGTQILVTNPETGNTADYSMTANFTPITANANDYGIDAAGTYFVPNVNINSFNAKVAATGNTKPAYLPIFGNDPDLTSLPTIPSAQLQNGIEVYTVTNGVTIQSEKEASLSIFEVSGKLVKEVLINEGLNYVTLPAGQYVINGSVIIVK